MISDVERYPSAPCDSSIAMSKNSEAAASRIYLLAFSPTAGEWSLFRVKNDVGVFAQCSDVEAGTLNSDRVRIIDNTRFSDGNPEGRVSSNARLDGHGHGHRAHDTHAAARWRRCYFQSRAPALTDGNLALQSAAPGTGAVWMTVSEIAPPNRIP